MPYDRKGKGSGNNKGKRFGNPPPAKWYEQGKKPAAPRGGFEEERTWAPKRERGQAFEARPDSRPARSYAPGKPRADEYAIRAPRAPGQSRPAYENRTQRAPRPEGAPRSGYTPRPEGAPRQGFAPKPERTPRPAFAPRSDRGPRPAFVPVRQPDAGVEADLPPENMLVGRNPIREALKSGRDMEKLMVARGDLSGSAREIISMARERHIVVQEVDRARLDALAPSHQGMVAFASAFRYSTLEDMLALAKEREEPPFLVVLDGITDPHNLGAIIRTAECAGAHGVIIPERRAVGLTPAAVKASAGAVEYVPVARTGNIPRVIEALKKLGIWVFAAAMEGERYDRSDLSGPLALVIGAEGEGISRLALEKCDHRIALPLAGRIGSLNASVAAGVLLYEVMRRRRP